MKVKNLFITFGLSLALGVVAAVGAGQKVERVSADYSYTAGDIFYFDNNNNSNWTGANRVAAYFFGDGDAWYDTLEVVTPAYSHSGTIYKFVLPDVGGKAYTHIIFVGLNTSDPASWGNKKVQTTDLEMKWFEGKNYFQINGTTYDGKYDCNWIYREPSIANGVYLRGVYQGVDHWGSNQVKLTGTGPYTCTTELYKDDEIKAVKYVDGELTEWMAFNTGAGGTETAKGTKEFPVTVSGSNAIVSKRATYKITITFNNEYESVNYWDYSFEDEATTWAKVFLGSMKCNNGGNSDLTWNIKEGETRWTWDDFANETTGSYAALGDIAKNALYGATAKDEGSQIEMAAKRHDACVAHYGWDAFMKNSSGTARASVRINGLPTIGTGTAFNPTILIITGAFILIAVGGFFLIRRKHN